MYFLLNMDIFHCYVSLPEGIRNKFPQFTSLAKSLFSIKGGDLEIWVRFSDKKKHLNALREFNICKWNFRVEKEWLAVPFTIIEVKNDSWKGQRVSCRSNPLLTSMI